MTDRPCGCGADVTVFGHTYCPLRLPYRGSPAATVEHFRWQAVTRREWAAESTYKLRLATGGAVYE